MSNGGAGPMVMDACDSGRHKLEARYDTQLVGDVVTRKKYVCDICTSCGHTVSRPVSLMDQLETGICTVEQMREFLKNGGAL